jgi:hypothetical protein
MANAATHRLGTVFAFVLCRAGQIGQFGPNFHVNWLDSVSAAWNGIDSSKSIQSKENGRWFFEAHWAVIQFSNCAMKSIAWLQTCSTARL